MTQPYISFAQVQLCERFMAADGFWYEKWSDESALVIDSEHSEDVGTMVSMRPDASVVYFEAR